MTYKKYNDGDSILTKAKTDKTIPKNQRSRRTSLWLDNGLRKLLDTRAKADNRSLAYTIEFYLRKGLGKPSKTEGATNGAETIFG